jgi:hypothetical protein
VLACLAAGRRLTARSRCRLPHALACAGRSKLPHTAARTRTRGAGAPPCAHLRGGGGPKLLRAVAAKLPHALTCAHRPKLAHALARAAAGQSSSMRSRRNFPVHLLMRLDQIWPMPSSSASSVMVAPFSLASSSARREVGTACRECGEGEERSGEGDEWMGLPLPSGCWKTSFLGL